VKEYYRIIEINPPGMESVDMLMSKYGAVHLRTSEGRTNTYRHFIARLDEDEIIILRLKYSYMSFNLLTFQEVEFYKKDGYIR
jgi:hypothetical protein